MGDEIKSKNILLISPTSKKEMAEVKWLSPHLGIIRLAGFLNNNGHNAEYIDTNFYLALNKEKALEEKLKSKKWDMIGFSVLDESLVMDIENMYLAKKLCPEAILVAGGIEAQFNYQTILDKSPCKIVILGEGEIPFFSLANNEPLEKIPGIVFRNDALCLNEELFKKITDSIEWEKVPYEVYWDFYVNKYKGKITQDLIDKIHTVRIFTRNRCPMKCNFCSSTNQLTWSSGNEAVPVIDILTDSHNLISMIEKIKKYHPRLRTIYFSDDEFCMKPSEVINFCKAIIAKNLDINFICLARIDKLNEEVVSWMAKAKFRVINIGIESFSQRTLNDLGKKYNTEIVKERIEILKRYGIHPFISIILISPNSSLDDIELTINKTLEHIKDGSVTASIVLACIPLKGSFFYEEYFDYMTEIVGIPGTKYKVKRPLMILAQDPYVREAQLKFHKEVDEEVQKKIREKKIIHATSANQAIIRLEFMKKILVSIREKYGLKFGENYEIPLEKGQLMASKCSEGAGENKYQGI